MKAAFVVGGLIAAGGIAGIAMKKRRAAHRAAEQHRRELERFEDEGGAHSMPI